jgi:hypothetical protein
MSSTQAQTCSVLASSSTETVSSATNGGYGRPARPPSRPDVTVTPVTRFVRRAHGAPP